MKENGFIHHLQTKQPAVWQLICSASEEGLINIDVDCDCVTATNRLLWSYPGLHEVLSHIINHWTENISTAQVDVSTILKECKKFE